MSSPTFKIRNTLNKLLFEHINEHEEDNAICEYLLSP